MSTSTHPEPIAVLDFGAQYAQLIARKIRQAHVYCEILPHDVSAERLEAFQPKGIVFTGGPASVYGDDAPHCDPRIFELGIPVLGICYGLQLMTHLLGGEVSAGAKREYGKAELEIDEHGDLFAGFGSQLTCWMSHGDLVLRPAPGFRALARTANCPIAAAGNPERKLYGVQFHPEVIHTERGEEILKNFLYRVCGCQGLWTEASIIDSAVERIRAEVGGQRVLCGLSGGVDSAVTAALVHRAIGSQLQCLFVNHGLLRKNEAEEVRTTFADHFQVKLAYVDASDRFLTKLEGVRDPEAKRKIIGAEFVRVFEEEAQKLGDFPFLAQGTLYSDVIESGTGAAATIKSHHNVGGLPEDMEFALVEPLRDLFKDEARAVGEQLGLPTAMVWRHPFPGPGLAIRIIGDVTPARLATLREADAIIREEIDAAGLQRDIFQVFAVLPAIQSVGVMGDQRTYGYPVVMRAVTSEDVMTADWARLPYDLLERIATRVVNEVPDVNRMVYDVTSKPPGTIEWE